MGIGVLPGMMSGLVSPLDPFVSRHPRFQVCGTRAESDAQQQAACIIHRQDLELIALAAGQARDILVQSPSLVRRCGVIPPQWLFTKILCKNAVIHCYSPVSQTVSDQSYYHRKS